MKKPKIIIKDRPDADYNSNKELLDVLDEIVEKRDEKKRENHENTM